MDNATGRRHCMSAGPPVHSRMLATGLGADGSTERLPAHLLLGIVSRILLVQGLLLLLLLRGGAVLLRRRRLLLLPLWRDALGRRLPLGARLLRRRSGGQAAVQRPAVVRRAVAVKQEAVLRVFLRGECCKAWIACSAECGGFSAMIMKAYLSQVSSWMSQMCCLPSAWT